MKDANFDTDNGSGKDQVNYYFGLVNKTEPQLVTLKSTTRYKNNQKLGDNTIVYNSLAKAVKNFDWHAIVWVGEKEVQSRPLHPNKDNTPFLKPGEAILAIIDKGQIIWTSPYCP
jgi:hypothetical protein